MWGRRRREADLHRALALETERRIAAEADAAEARQVQRFEVDQRANAQADAQAGVRRVNDRVRALREDLEAATERYQAAEKRIDVLEKQVDDLTGMDDPQIAAGASWQHSRADKQPGFEQPRTSPSGLLPRREPDLPEQGAAS